jgi:hypothetical protein
VRLCCCATTSDARLRAFRKTWLETVGRTAHSFPVIGDSRASNAESLASLFAASGFIDCGTERVVVRRPGTPREVAEHYGLYYPPASLPDVERKAFVDNLTEALGQLEPNGKGLALVATLLHVRARLAP